MTNRKPPSCADQAATPFTLPGLAEIRLIMETRGAEKRTPPAGPKLASVALMLAGPEISPSLCVIRRAEREGDPWSGHMAFPGGRGEPEDSSPRITAERETMEEVGVRLEPGHFMGFLATLPVRIMGRDTGMTLFSFLYYLGGEQPRLRLNSEVAEAFWIPLDHLLNIDKKERINIALAGKELSRPSISFDGHHIWGLSYRIIQQFSEILGRPLPMDDRI